MNRSPFCTPISNRTATRQLANSGRVFRGQGRVGRSADTESPQAETEPLSVTCFVLMQLLPDAGILVLPVPHYAPDVQGVPGTLVRQNTLTSPQVCRNRPKPPTEGLGSSPFGASLGPRRNLRPKVSVTLSPSAPAGSRGPIRHGESGNRRKRFMYRSSYPSAAGRLLRCTDASGWRTG